MYSSWLVPLVGAHSCDIAHGKNKKPTSIMKLSERSLQDSSPRHSTARRPFDSGFATRATFTSSALLPRESDKFNLVPDFFSLM